MNTTPLESETNPWKIGSVYLVQTPKGGAMGKLIEVNPIELVFARTENTAPEIEPLEANVPIYKGNNIVIISRYCVSYAEMMLPKAA